ncbi:MAG TPA: hypothetical protein VLE22_06920 [Bryobacteraceae bacterium]|nr:hypothetical protein [Bryobacteraceae bacterium]
MSALLALATVLAAGANQPEKVVPAINDVEIWQQVGQQPYEFTWVQREEHPQTLVDFEDLKDWRLEMFDGGSGEFRRSREQQLWGQYVGKFLYSGSRPGSRIVARPPKPIPIPGKFDSIDIWGYGHRWGRRVEQVTPRVDISVWLVDARGKEFKFFMNDVKWRQWWLLHRRIPKEVQAQMLMPASFAGIEVAMGETREPRYFYCDSLAFYVEDLKPLALKPQPRRNLKPFRGQIAGLNTGPDKLPFPTREETILPSNFEKDFQVSVRQTGPAGFELQYKGRDATTTYNYRPRSGSLSELSAAIDGGKPFQPLHGGGVRFTDTPKDRVSEGELLSAELAGDVIKAKFRHGSRIVDYELRLWQKSIVLDVWCDGGEAVELSFGRIAGVTNPKIVPVPYISYRYTNPRVLMSGSETKPLFTSVWFDWYRSNASEPYCSPKPLLTADGGEANGGMRYIPKTDGLRNNLYERVFITSSPVYEETFPTIANPPSLAQEKGKQVVWTVTAPPTFQSDHKRSREIRSYGMDKIMQHSHEVTWRDDGDSFTMRLKAAPQKGGDAMLRWYLKAQNDMGWTQGVYTNYTDFAPVNTNWSPDHVQRLPDGEWRRAWPRNYALKPSKAVEFDEYYAQRIKRKFNPMMSYTDVHTAVPPWEYCDFDARVPGAGTFAATFYAYGQLLLNDQKEYGVCQTEATFQWLYAGLDSGSYGWVYSDINILGHPLDVAFRLHKIHPLHCDYGIGAPDRHLTELDPGWRQSPKRRQYIDLFLASTIAYGNMGWLVKDFFDERPFGIEVMARSYYMMQQLQQQYAYVPVAKIEYADGAGRFVTPSQAQAGGALKDSKVHVVYENGTEVYVNGSASSPWSVRDSNGKSVELPPYGWLVFNAKSKFYEMSANAGGRRIDYVTAPEYEYLDGRGQWSQQGNLGSAGAVALRQKAEGVLELIDIYGNGRIGFRAAFDGVLMAYDPDGAPLGKVETSPREGWCEFTPLAGARSYVFASAQ